MRSVTLGLVQGYNPDYILGSNILVLLGTTEAMLIA